MMASSVPGWPRLGSGPNDRVPEATISRPSGVSRLIVLGLFGCASGGRPTSRHVGLLSIRHRPPRTGASSRNVLRESPHPYRPPLLPLLAARPPAAQLERASDARR